MSRARNLAAIAGRLGALALLDSVEAESVSGLGSLATKSSVTEADLSANANKRIPRAWGLVNAANGALLAGHGLTSSRSGVGAYAITLSTPAPDANYGVVVTSAHAQNLTVDENTGVARTESAFALRGRNTNTGTVADPVTFTVAVFY